MEPFEAYDVFTGAVWEEAEGITPPEGPAIYARSPIRPFKEEPGGPNSDSLGEVLKSEPLVPGSSYRILFPYLGRSGLFLTLPHVPSQNVRWKGG